jgi:hypothetical protein
MTDGSANARRKHPPSSLIEIPGTWRALQSKSGKDLKSRQKRTFEAQFPLGQGQADALSTCSDPNVMFNIFMGLFDVAAAILLVSIPEAALQHESQL